MNLASSKPLEKLREKEKTLANDLVIIKKAIEIMEQNPDWAIIIEAMNH